MLVVIVLATPIPMLFIAFCVIAHLVLRMCSGILRMDWAGGHVHEPIVHLHMYLHYRIHRCKGCSAA